MTATPLNDLAIYEVPLTDLKPYGKNPRIGNVEAIVESLRVNGQFRPIVVRRETSEILAGNHTWKAATKLGWPTIKVSYVEEISDDDAARIVLADNRYADLATYDDRILADLLSSLSGAWNGTGYGLDDIENLIEDLTEPVAVPNFKPEAEEVNPSLDSRVRHECPHCENAFEIVNGKPKAVA